MRSPPSEKDILDELSSIEESSYTSRLYGDIDSKGMGRASAILYGIGGGRRHFLYARRLGGAIGINTRIVDDLLDGDGCEAVEDREDFMERYIESFRNGTVFEPVEVPEETLAYESASILNSYLQETKPEAAKEMVDTMENMKDLLHEEDKTQVRPYREYVKAAGGLHGELIVESLDVFPDYELNDKKRDLARTFGEALQVGDDIVDQDVRLEDGSLEEEFEKSLAELKDFDSRTVDVLTLMQPRHLRYLIDAENYIREKTPGILR